MYKVLDLERSSSLYSHHALTSKVSVFAVLYPRSVGSVPQHFPRDPSVPPSLSGITGSPFSLSPTGSGTSHLKKKDPPSTPATHSSSCLDSCFPFESDFLNAGFVYTHSLDSCLVVTLLLLDHSGLLPFLTTSLKGFCQNHLWCLVPNPWDIFLALLLNIINISTVSNWSFSKHSHLRFFWFSGHSLCRWLLKFCLRPCASAYRSFSEER